MQKLLSRINGFIKKHSSCPHTVAAASTALQDHNQFLQSLNTSVDQLKSVSESLKEDTPVGVKQKVLSLVSRVDRRINERVSVLDKRLVAFTMIKELHDTNDSVSLAVLLVSLSSLFIPQCYSQLNSFSALVPTDISSLSLSQLNKLLESCDTSLASLESAATEYSKSTRSFTSLSTDLEMDGIDARRNIRRLLRQFETQLASTVDSYQGMRKIIVIREKQKKVCFICFYHYYCCCLLLLFIVVVYCCCL